MQSVHPGFVARNMVLMSTPGLFNLDQRLGIGAHLWWIMQFGDVLHHLGARCRVLASKVSRFPSHMCSSNAFHCVWT